MPRWVYAFKAWDCPTVTLFQKNRFRDKVKEGEITLHKVDTTENVSDIMTKSLTSATFKKHAENMLETIKSKSAVDFSKLTKALEGSQVATIDFS